MAEWSKAPVSYLADQWDAGSIPGPAKIPFCDEIFLNSSRVYYSNDLTISLKIKKLIFAKIRPGKSSVPLFKKILWLPLKRWQEVT